MQIPVTDFKIEFKGNYNVFDEENIQILFHRSLTSTCSYFAPYFILITVINFYSKVFWAYLM